MPISDMPDIVRHLSDTFSCAVSSITEALSSVCAQVFQGLCEVGTRRGKEHHGKQKQARRAEARACLHADLHLQRQAQEL